PAPPLLQTVPETDSKLVFTDIRLWRWTSAAFDAVAARDQYLIEPHISSYVANELRNRIGAVLDPKLREKQRYPVLAIVSGTQFLRDLAETDRSSTMYDLLFARQRFKEEVKATKKSYYHKGGDLIHPGTGKLIRNLEKGEYWYDVVER